MGVEDSTADTGGFISSIATFEKAEQIEPALLTFIQEVIKFECVSDNARKRLQAIIEKHSRTE